MLIFLLSFTFLLKIYHFQIFVDQSSSLENPTGAEESPFKNLSSALQNYTFSIDLNFILEFIENAYEFFEIFPPNHNIYIMSSQ